MIDILSLVKGPDLDVRIGVDVMGWHVARDDGTGEVDRYPYLYQTRFTGGWMVDTDENKEPRSWHPSTDWADALQVFFRVLTTVGWANISADMEDYGREPGDIVTVTMGDGWTVTGIGPLAICQAALLALQEVAAPLSRDV